MLHVYESMMFLLFINHKEMYNISNGKSHTANLILILLLCQSWAVELIITCDAIGLWSDWDHYGNKFLTFSVYILCLVRILLHSS